VRCEGGFSTGNPPQWQMTFRLHDTRYVALVVIRGDPPGAGALASFWRAGALRPTACSPAGTVRRPDRPI